MPLLNLDPARSALLVIDVQTGLVPFIFESERLVSRVRFLTRIAKLLEIPIVATEQNPQRMGPTEDAIRTELVEAHIYSKMEFGADRCADCLLAIKATGRTQVVLIGIETHICVAQTARGLLARGLESIVCPDGVSARSVDRHRLGMEQIRDCGVIPAHTEAVAYEWLGSADHPKFRQALAIVKEG